MEPYFKKYFHVAFLQILYIYILYFLNIQFIIHTPHLPTVRPVEKPIVFLLSHQQSIKRIEAMIFPHAFIKHALSKFQNAHFLFVFSSPQFTSYGKPLLTPPPPHSLNQSSIIFFTAIKASKLHKESFVCDIYFYKVFLLHSPSLLFLHFNGVHPPYCILLVKKFPPLLFISNASFFMIMMFTFPFMFS